MKHGILSKLTVLPWENQDEYDALHAAFVEEHRPVGPTEEHLVEELAAIFWRKRRLRLAEAATFRGGLKDAIDNITLFPFQASMMATLVYGCQPEPTDDNALIFTDIIYSNPKDSAEEAGRLRLVVDRIEKALLDLMIGENDAYDSALMLLDPLIQLSWEEMLKKSARQSEARYTATADSLMNWIKAEAYPYFQRRFEALNNKDAFKQQVFGESFKPDRLEKLARYETHLDRKLERTLAMLVKLQELRRQRESGEAALGESQ